MVKIGVKYNKIYSKLVKVGKSSRGAPKNWQKLVGASIRKGGISTFWAQKIKFKKSMKFVKSAIFYNFSTVSKQQIVQI